MPSRQKRSHLIFNRLRAMTLWPLGLTAFAIVARFVLQFVPGIGAPFPAYVER
jgi:hypothetical protein